MTSASNFSLPRGPKPSVNLPRSRVRLPAEKNTRCQRARRYRQPVRWFRGRIIVFFSFVRSDGRSFGSVCWGPVNKHAVCESGDQCKTGSDAIAAARARLYRQSCVKDFRPLGRSCHRNNCGPGRGVECSSISGCSHVVGL